MGRYREQLTPPPPPPYRARARSRQHTPPPPHPLLGAISALCPRALNTHTSTTPLPYSVTVAYPGFQRGGCLRSGAIREGGWGGGGGGGAVSFWPDTKSGGGGGGPGRQRKRTAIIIKRGPKRYEFIYGRTYGRGGCSNTRSTLSGYATAVIPNKSGRLLVTIIEAREGGGGGGMALDNCRIKN